MKRKFILLEVETEMTNKQLKVRGFWEALGVKIIQVKVNMAKKEVR